MKTFKFLLLIIAVINSISCLQCQNTKQISICEEENVHRQIISDSLTTPTYIYGSKNLFQVLKKHLFYTDSISCGDHENRIIDFWIKIDNKGKIIMAEITSYYNVNEQFKKNFVNLIQEIDNWNPSYEKSNNIVAEEYYVFFRIEVNNKDVKVRLLNKDSERLYEHTFMRPLKE